MNKNGFIGKALSGVLIVIAVMTLHPSVCAGSDRTPKFIEYVSSGSYFKCSIPANWSVYDLVFGLSAEEKKVFGVTLLGPQNGRPVVPEISVHYYAPGNLLHKTMDRFIRLHSEPVFDSQLEGESHGKVRQVEIVGRKAKAFERISVRFVGKRALNMPKVSIFEKYVVVPAGNGEGFYVLKFSVFDKEKDQYG
jgi:hypothetical protein